MFFREKLYKGIGSFIDDLKCTFTSAEEEVKGKERNINILGKRVGYSCNCENSYIIWTKNSIGLLSVIASLIAGCHLGRKHTGSMHQLGTALILVFIVWLICVNILPTTMFYLLGISHPTAFTCVNMFSAFSNTLVYIYAYYRMYRTINN